VRCAEEAAGDGEPRVDFEALGDTEIADANAALVVEETVGWFDVAVDDAEALARLESIDQVQHVVDGLLGRKSALFQAIGERASRHQLHRDHGHAVELFGGEDVDTARVTDRGSEPALLPEPFDRLARIGTQLGQHLQRQTSAGLTVFRLPYLGKPADTELARQLIRTEVTTSLEHHSWTAGVGVRDRSTARLARAQRGTALGTTNRGSFGGSAAARTFDSAVHGMTHKATDARREGKCGLRHLQYYGTCSATAPAVLRHLWYYGTCDASNAKTVFQSCCIDTTVQPRALASSSPRSSRPMCDCRS
jgi:hypothetical protein